MGKRINYSSLMSYTFVLFIILIINFSDPFETEVLSNYMTYREENGVSEVYQLIDHFEL